MCVCVPTLPKILRPVTRNETRLFFYLTQFYTFCLSCPMINKSNHLLQLELQESPKHLGIYNETSKELMTLLTTMLSKIWDGTHTCIDDIETVNCTFCQNIALWHQLAAQVMQHFSPRDPVKIPSKDIPKVEDLQGLNATSKEGKGFLVNICFSSLCVCQEIEALIVL